MLFYYNHTHSHTISCVYTQFVFAFATLVCHNLTNKKNIYIMENVQLKEKQKKIIITIHDLKNEKWKTQINKKKQQNEKEAKIYKWKLQDWGSQKKRWKKNYSLWKLKKNEENTESTIYGVT